MPRDDHEKNDQPVASGFSLSYSLRGRQSVRATFKLSAECIETMSIVAAQLGIKQKSLFDHLVEDSDTLAALARKLRKFTKEDSSYAQSDRVQKTFVLSRRSLLSLERVANAFNTPRDALVELSVQRLLPIILREREKHNHRKGLLSALEEHRRAAHHLADRLHDLLGEEDPMSQQFAAALSALDHSLLNIYELVERGRALEEFRVSELSE